MLYNIIDRMIYGMQLHNQWGDSHVPVLEAEINQLHRLLIDAKVHVEIDAWDTKHDEFFYGRPEGGYDETLTWVYRSVSFDFTDLPEKYNELFQELKLTEQRAGQFIIKRRELKWPEEKVAVWDFEEFDVGRS